MLRHSKLFHQRRSVDTSVRIEADDRAGLERLLRYCARPAFAMERLRKAGNDLVYRCAKQHSEPGGDWRADQRGVNQRAGNQGGVKQDEITLTPLELIDRIAALIPPPRTHRHRYYGALAPNSSLRAAVTAMAMPAQQAQQSPAHAPATCQPTGLPVVLPAQAGAGAAGAAMPANAVPIAPEPKRSPAHYLWAALIARIYEIFPLLCPLCGGQMRIIAFITHSAEIRQILDHIGVDSEPPRLSPARGPPLWDGGDADAQRGEEGEAEPDWELAAQPTPDYEVDQRVSW
jgi:hypothetical protein